MGLINYNNKILGVWPTTLSPPTSLTAVDVMELLSTTNKLLPPMAQMLCSLGSNVEHNRVVFFSRSLRIRSEKASDSDSTQVVPNNKGKGFGSGSSKRKEREKGGGSRRRERASIIRRSPVEKPAFVSEQQDEEGNKERNNNESAFILAWLGFGAVILVEGISLAASGK